MARLTLKTQQARIEELEETLAASQQAEQQSALEAAVAQTVIDDLEQTLAASQEAEQEAAHVAAAAQNLMETANACHISQADVDAAAKAAVDAYRIKINAWLIGERNRVFKAGQASITGAPMVLNPAYNLDAQQRTEMDSWWKTQPMSNKNHTRTQIFEAWQASL